VRATNRHLTNRPVQFNDQHALVAGLPIGSGEIESAHRYVIQDRLKRAGAWWKLKNVRHMLALRACRANPVWDRYWLSRGQQAASRVRHFLRAKCINGVAGTIKTMG